MKKSPSAAKRALPPKKAASAAGGKKAVAKKAASTKVSPNSTAANVRVVEPTTKVSVTKVTRASATKAATPAVKETARASGRTTNASALTAEPQRLRVREDEKPWTLKELATVRTELESDIDRLRREISVAELDLADLMRDVGDGAGDDPADAGTATFEREQEISLANNAREVFEQSSRALARLVDQSYGICESCGDPIGKNRLLAFPRATLCLTCKSKQERR